MKYGTAVRHLSEMAETAGSGRDWDEWVLTAMWTGHEVLGGPQQMGAPHVILMLDIPPDELPWRAIHSQAEAIKYVLRIPKVPVLAYPRPTVLPPWNPIHRRVVRFWDHNDGTDHDVLEALRQRAPLPIVCPTLAEYQAQMLSESNVARARLDQMLDDYWIGNWRKEHRGAGIFPENHLWAAAQALRDTEIALST